MNKLLRKLMSIYMLAADGGDGGGAGADGGAGGGTDGGTGNAGTQNAGSGNADAGQAREFLVQYGHSADAIKSMADADVLKLHGTVNEAITKARTAAVEEFKTAEQKRQEQEIAERKAKAPATYELKLAEGTLLDQTVVDKVVSIAKDQGLSTEQAQALLNEAETNAAEARASRIKAWETAVKADKEIGGEHWPKTDANIQRFRKAFIPQDSGIHKLLDTTGYGSHPEVVRLMSAIGAAMAEDKTAINAGGAGGGKTAADVLYGKNSS
jgi:hypothetical protein